MCVWGGGVGGAVENLGGTCNQTSLSVRIMCTEPINMFIF